MIRNGDPMGRHNTDPIPLRDLLRDSGPMKRIRGDMGNTVELPPVPAEETKRRIWPVVVVLAVGLSGAVGIPLGLSSSSRSLPAVEPPPTFSDLLSASPEPAPTAEESPSPAPTKTIYLRSAPKPGPTRTIFRTLVPSPGPTVYRDHPVPGPTVTIRLPRPTVTVTEYETEFRCYRIRNSIEVETACPGE